jgi:hypothetical protein
VDIAAKPTIPITNLFAMSLQLVCTGAPPVPVTFTLKGTSYTNLPFYSFLTPKVGPAFGNNGAAFAVPCNIEVGKTYFARVRAVSPHGDVGNWSVYQSFIWSPSNTPALQVPWPARPLPTTNANFFTFALYLSPTNASSAEAAAAPSGNAVLVGYSSIGNEPYSVTNLPPHFKEIKETYNPNLALETNSFGDAIFPCTLYRYQVPSALFPTVSGDVIQVSPLMENIAYNQLRGDGYFTCYITDPFIAVTGASLGTANAIYLWIRDTQPQISGAKYKYILVHFDPVSHEIDQLIPSNEVQVP